ncbi:MAG TPA: beta-propeller fold lactonase family protein [Nakamurella sp.]|nr:beta-propeller fold lactonase family protein [Nakamurella sp.]
MTDREQMLLAVGCYSPDDAAGDAPPALSTWWWDGTGPAIRPAGSASVTSASFVCWHPTLPVLYAVSEVDEGSLDAFRVAEDGSLEPAGRLPTGGSHPCWVTTDPSASMLLIANYASGSLAVLALDRAGLPVGPPTVVQHHGSGPRSDRQEGPHVHQAVPTADGHVLVTDLGTDTVTVYRIDAGDGPAASPSVRPVQTVAMPPGSGPRHITLAAGGSVGYVSGELDGTVTVIRRDAGGWAAGEQLPCSEIGGSQPSHLQLVDGDRWLLVANRGPDTLAVLDVAAGLTIRQEVSTGRWPRHFVPAGDRVLLACQQGNAVDLLALDAAAGSLTPLGSVTTPAGSGPAAEPSTRPGSATAPPGSPFVTPACLAIRPDLRGR